MLKEINVFKSVLIINLVIMSQGHVLLNVPLMELLLLIQLVIFVLLLVQLAILQMVPHTNVFNNVHLHYMPMIPQESVFHLALRHRDFLLTVVLILV